MILEGEFFSGDHLRWNIGWPTPNYAGAFLVTLLALTFVFSSSRWRWAFLLAEVGGLFLLAKSYSRGAVVAWGLAWLFGVVASHVWRNPAQRLVWAARASAMVVMLLAAGFGWSRAEVAKNADVVSTTQDGSVVNRLALWRGGLKMIVSAPLTGWGAGESGRAYMNWFQDVDRDEGFTTMVNSYLHVAVEHGLPILVVVGWIGAWLLLVAWRGAGNSEQSEPRERLRERETTTIQQMGSVATGAYSRTTGVTLSLGIGLEDLAALPNQTLDYTNTNAISLGGIGQAVGGALSAIGAGLTAAAANVGSAIGDLFDWLSGSGE